jgi:hypothetical protein
MIKVRLRWLMPVMHIVEVNMQRMLSENLMEEGHFEFLSTDGRVILKWILNK